MNPFQSDNIWKKKARQGKAQQHPLTPQQEWQKQVNRKQKKIDNAYRKPENLRIFRLLFFGFPRRAQSCRAGFMAFIKFFSAGYVLFCVPKENQKSTRYFRGAGGTN